MNETNLVRLGLIAASSEGARMFRQNTGQGWIGRGEQVPGGVFIANARPFHAGFKGLLDTSGFVPVTITADMVGQTLPVYAEIEYKTQTGRLSAEQVARIAYLCSVGAVTGVARSEADVRAIIRGERRD